MAGKLVNQDNAASVAVTMSRPPLAPGSKENLAYAEARESQKRGEPKSNPHVSNSPAWVAWEGGWVYAAGAARQYQTCR